MGFVFIVRPKNTTGSVMDPIFRWRSEADAPLGGRVMVRAGFEFKVATPALTAPCGERVWVDDKGDRVTDVTGWLPLNEAPEIET